MESFYQRIAAENRYPKAVPASEEEIGLAEEELGLRFSEDYRSFLRLVGGCIWNRHEINGLAKSDYMNVVAATKTQRRLNPEVYRSWYLLENTYSEGILIWQDPDGGVWQTQRGTNPVKLADGLLEYLLLQE